MRLLPDISTASSSTMSATPQVSGPISRGIGSATARPASLASQAVGWSVTSAELKFSPATASAKVAGSGQAGGRDRGRGTLWMMAMAVPSDEGFSEVLAFCSGFDFLFSCCDTPERPLGRYRFIDPNQRSPEGWA
jgi:hypothetical protein